MAGGSRGRFPLGTARGSRRPPRAWPGDKSDCHFRKKQLLNVIVNWYKVVELYCEVTIGYNPSIYRDLQKTAGSTCNFWVNPVNFTFELCHARQAQPSSRNRDTTAPLRHALRFACGRGGLFLFCSVVSLYPLCLHHATLHTRIRQSEMLRQQDS